MKETSLHGIFRGQGQHGRKHTAVKQRGWPGGTVCFVLREPKEPSIRVTGVETRAQGGVRSEEALSPVLKN